MEDDATITRDRLKDAAFTGARWMTVSRLAAEFLMFGSSIAMARLLTPAEFGHAVIALVVTAMAAVLTFEGIGTPLVQRPVIGRQHLETAAALGLGLGVVLGAATAAFAIAIAPALFGSETTGLLQLASLSFVIAGVGVAPRAQLQRRLDFRRMGLIEVAALLASLVTSLTLAASGAGAISIVAGALAMNAVTVGLYLRCAPRTVPRWHRAAAAEIAGFGTPAAVSSLTWAVHRNIDYAIVAARLGPVAAGLYWRAFQMGVGYQTKISGILGRLAFPVLSRASDLHDMRRIRLRIVRLHTVLIFPLLLLFVVSAPEVVPFVFGDPWRPAVVPAQILAVAALASPVVAGVGPMLMAAGRPKPLMATNLVFLAVYAAAVYLAAGYSLVAVCVAGLAVNLFKLVCVHHFLLHRVLGIPPRQVIDDVKPAGVSAVALLAAAVLVQVLAGQAGVSDATGTFGAVLAGAGTYALVLRSHFPQAWADLHLLAARALSRTGTGRGSGQPPRRIAITNVVSLNTGDAAILHGVARLLRRAFGDGLEIVAHDSSPEVAAALHPGLEFRRLPYLDLGASSRRGRTGRLVRRVRQSRVLLAARVWGAGHERIARLFLTRREAGVIADYDAFDAVVSTGGTYLVETYSLEPRIFEFRLALAMRKPLVLYTQSLGPFVNAGWRRDLRRALTRADLILLRDHRSLVHLTEIGIPATRMALSADAAFALADDGALAAGHEPRLSGERPRVAVSVRRWGAFKEASPEDGMARYREAIAGLVISLVREHGAEVSFVSTCQGVPDYWLDDSSVASEIASLLPADVALNVTIDSGFRDPERLIELLREFDLVVATRMHMAILALCAGTPVVPVAYEFKTRALFERLGFESLVQDIDDVDGAALARTAGFLLDERSAVAGPLFEAVRTERARALDSADIVAASLSGAAAFASTIAGEDVETAGANPS